ncbi:TorD/DmsD family molecular chaperone [Nitratidesulfovibrio sp. 1201_IL3209]|uniref:TorD/DmsD family molecular chaperone n=1 Tax=Nitratidesulfovibrio sp. 1201_IL3209 TaxID=3084053 RepID=UPI002FD9D4EF
MDINPTPAGSAPLDAGDARDVPAIPEGHPVGDARQAALLRGLRDLFAARSADDLRAASLALDACVAEHGGPASLPPNASARHDPATGHAHPPGEDQWREAEYAFNRLFVGPMAVPAPPYASAWLETEPRLMGESTMDVRALYHALGYAVPGEGTTPDDHLSFELDAALALLALRDADHPAAIVPSPAHPTPAEKGEEPGLAVEDAWRWLVAEHMGAWVPRFVQRALAEPGVPPAIARALALLLCWQEDAAAACAHHAATKEITGASGVVQATDAPAPHSRRS